MPRPIGTARESSKAMSETKFKPDKHTNTLSEEHNMQVIAETMEGGLRVCVLYKHHPTSYPGQYKSKGYACNQPVRWIPIVHGTGALFCPNHGEVAFDDTVGGDAAKRIDARERLQ